MDWPGTAKSDPQVAELRERLLKVVAEHRRGLLTDFDFAYAVTTITAELNGLEDLEG